MGYLGTKPANAVLTSEQIGDGVITTADIASGVTINFADGSASTPSITNDGDTNTGIFFPAADTIAFAEGGAEVARFDSSGNLGLGTSSPSAKLQVANGNLRLSDGFQIEFGGNTNAIAGANASNYLQFYTNNTERMRIDSSGNLLVGTTSAPTGSTGGAGFIATTNGRRVLISGTTSTTSNRLVEFENPNGTVGNISTSGSATTYATSSDYRLKENIVPMVGALSVVNQLKPCTYKWKADGSDGQGFIAHELAEVVPDAVVGEKDAVDADGNPVYQGIDTSFLVATLTAAIQEQQSIITELKTRIEALEQA